MNKYYFYESDVFCRKGLVDRPSTLNESEVIQGKFKSYVNLTNGTNERNHFASSDRALRMVRAMKTRVP